MLPFMEKIFNREKKNSPAEIIEPVKSIHKLHGEMLEREKKIEDEKYKILLSQQDELFLSLRDFFELMGNDDTSMDSIINNSKHITELKNKVSVTETHSFVEDQHLVLCSDKKKCKKHKDLDGNLIRITTIKVVK